MHVPVPRGSLNLWARFQLLWRLPTVVRLIARLVRDSRVERVRKLLYFAALAFIVSPLDVPNYVPVLGQLSDIALALLACRWFINSAPPVVVEQHMAALRSRPAPRVRA